MPDVTGLKLVEKARRLRPDLPVILCSGRREQIDPESATRLGIGRYLEKPIDLSLLRDVVESLLV